MTLEAWVPFSILIVFGFIIAVAEVIGLRAERRHLQAKLKQYSSNETPTEVLPE